MQTQVASQQADKMAGEHEPLQRAAKAHVLNMTTLSYTYTLLATSHVFFFSTACAENELPKASQVINCRVIPTTYFGIILVIAFNSDPKPLDLQPESVVARADIDKFLQATGLLV